MQTRYRITPKGMMYAIAFSDKDITGSLLIRILKQYLDVSVSFFQICEYLENNKKTAFKIICEMLESEFIDIDETRSESDKLKKPVNIRVADRLKDNKFIISDFNGLTIHNSGFKPEEAQYLSSMACDLIRISRRSEKMGATAHSLQPVSVETTWNHNEIIIYLLFLGGYSCLLTCKNYSFLKQVKVIPLISHLCNRYADG